VRIRSIFRARRTGRRTGCRRESFDPYFALAAAALLGPKERTVAEVRCEGTLIRGVCQFQTAADRGNRSCWNQQHIGPATCITHLTPAPRHKRSSAQIIPAASIPGPARVARSVGTSRKRPRPSHSLSHSTPEITEHSGGQHKTEHQIDAHPDREGIERPRAHDLELAQARG
jgi:hypothetical protein